jgi:hypothetical protein
MNKKSAPDISKIMLDGKLIDDAMDEAADEARRIHQLHKLPLVCWRNNQIVYVDPFTDKIVPAPKTKSNGRRPRR